MAKPKRKAPGIAGIDAERAEVWLRAWCACAVVPQATWADAERGADRCLSDYDKRFAPTI